MRAGRHLARVALALVALLALPARAAPPPRCKVDNANVLAFGLYNPFAAAPLDALGSVGYDCMTTPGPIISVGPGSGSFALRTMRQGGSVLGYNVYMDAARTLVLGDGTGGTQTLDGTNARKQTFPLHGRIFAGQMVAVGTYTDTLVVTIVF